MEPTPEIPFPTLASLLPALRELSREGQQLFQIRYRQPASQTCDDCLSSVTEQVVAGDAFEAFAAFADAHDPSLSLDAVWDNLGYDTAPGRITIEDDLELLTDFGIRGGLSIVPMAVEDVNLPVASLGSRSLVGWRFALKMRSKWTLNWRRALALIPRSVKTGPRNSLLTNIGPGIWGNSTPSHANHR